ncbi:hypothetical protein N825_13285 [Skermanella stibiiresistens SB22]|uniref:histidine kinase n=1 Tax=Skermanella stibiiresistens SB22 TaxID=1385369 RepID=W9H1C0_9PROT|nr:sensor histidine kinase [Skermanella stibiiresistens]EWY38512.1 hypothetical protein N825_13285 [Skermanella stibiiresistens SB22]
MAEAIRKGSPMVSSPDGEQDAWQVIQDLRQRLVVARLEGEQSLIDCEELREQVGLYAGECATLEAQLEAVAARLARAERALVDIRHQRDEERAYRRSLERQLLASRMEAETAEEEFRVALEELDHSSRDLAESNESLRNLNETLERQVDQRTSALRAALADRDALIHEIHHQTRNNLQVISSLLNLQASRLEEPSASEVRKSFGRIQTMSLVHGLVFDDSSTADTPLRPLLVTVCDSLTRESDGSSTKTMVRVTGDDGLVPLKAAGPLALIVAELIGNSLAHAFTSSGGAVEINITGRRRVTGITVSDDGIGLDDARTATRKGLGLLLVRTLARQIGARLCFLSSGTPDAPTGHRGTSVEILLPWAAE